MSSLSIPHAFELAVQHHRAGRLPQAEAIYQQILAVAPEHADALHLLGVIAHQTARNDRAVDLIRRAIAIKPEDAEAHNNLGIALRAKGQLEEAVAAYRRATAIKPEYAEAHGNLGNALREMGRLDDAIAECRQAIALRPHHAEAHSDLANALCENGRLDEAIAESGKAIALKPNLSSAHNSLGVALMEKEELDAAIVAYRQAVALKPDYADAHLNLGVALKRMGQVNEAIAAFRRAIAIKPELAEAHNNLGNVLKDQGQAEQAIAAYRMAIQFKSDYAEAYGNLGDALKERGQWDEAIAAHRTAVQLRPDLAESHFNLGNTFNDLGQLDQAIAAYRRAIELKPQYAIAHNNLGAAFKDAGHLEEALEFFGKAMVMEPEGARFHSNFAYTIHFHPSYDSAAILAEHRRWAEKFEAPLTGEHRPHDNDHNPRRRLRIGYVSPDFRRHAAACFLLPLLSHHDPDNVEVYCYASVKRPDSITAQMQQLPLQWRNCRAMSDAELAEAVRQDGIDILVDLTLHMADNRLLAFARKPAPIQVTWLGYPSTTGLSSIDYRLSDPYLDPPGIGDEFYSERSVRLPHSFWCYRPLTDDTPPVNPPPAETNGFVTFGCFNNFAKVTTLALQSWMEILKAAPRSRLLLQSQAGSQRQRVARLFEDAGISAERLEFVPPASPVEYFRYYHRVDLCLDPMPYPGHTSNLDALWMGVPSVTMCGRTAVARGGASIMNNVGLPQFVAGNEREYVSIAGQWSGNPRELAVLRASLRSRLQSSLLMDARRFAGDMEAAFGRMWRDHCAGRRAER